MSRSWLANFIPLITVAVQTPIPFENTIHTDSPTWIAMAICAIDLVKQSYHLHVNANYIVVGIPHVVQLHISANAKLKHTLYRF